MLIKRIMIRRIILQLAVIFISITSLAQEFNLDDAPVIDYTRSRNYEIADIRVSGIEFLQEEVLISLSGLSKGQVISVPGTDITNVIKKFWSQGLFSDVKITADKIEGNKIWLNIYLQERPRLSRLTIHGLKKGETTDLTEKLSIRTGSQVTADLLNNMTRIIKLHFIDKGFLNIDIDIVQKDDTIRPNMVTLDVTVNKNARVKIEDIIFSGNQNFSDKRLMRVMKDTKRRNINIFKASKLITAKFRDDKNKLIAFYNENGFRDAEIVSDSITVVSENRINLFIDLFEGDKYYFGNISWVGNTIYPSDYLTFKLGIEKGEVFDQSILDKRLFQADDAVQNLYLNNGYLFSQLDPVEVSIYNDTIDFEMRIYEGKQATIENIIIEGNTKTNEHVIRRELRTRPGDLFSREDIIRTVRELAQLGHFDPEKIAPEPIPNPSEGTVDIRYVLEEKANDQLELSGGWGMGMLVGTLGLRFSNFSASRMFDPKAWRPVPSGDGQTLSLRAQSNGKAYQAYNATFVEPWFGGKKPNSFSVSAYHTIMNNYNYFTFSPSSQYIKITGASLGLGRRLEWPDDFFTLQNEISYQRYKLEDWAGLFLFSNGISKNLSFRTMFGRSSVDQPIYARRGSSFMLGLQLTPPYSLINNKDYSTFSDEDKYKWIEYHKWTFKSDYYMSLAGNLVLYTRAHFGYLGFYNKDIGPSPFESFDLGGDGLTGYNLYGRETIALRGYENGSLTPLIDNKKAGNVYTKYTAELRYPFSLNPSATVFGLIFVEGGNAWYKFGDFNPFLFKRSAGVGLRAFLPMFGLLGVDWGYGFDNIPGQPGANKGQFHFTIGQQF
jgi:outer membrane protein insertion porin family